MKREIDMKVKNKGLKSLLVNSFTKPFKAMFSNNENTITEPVNNNDVKKFNAVIDAVHAREEERGNRYKESMRADGKLQEMNELSKSRYQVQKPVRKDRADD